MFNSDCAELAIRPGKVERTGTCVQRLLLIHLARSQSAHQSLHSTGVCRS